MQSSIGISAVLVSIILFACMATADVQPGMAKATFVVHCYDVGASALTGKPGVLSVERGWSGAREVDRVIFDPRHVSVTQLENWLKEADTYVSTLETSVSSEPAQGMSQ